jgi:membrane-bound lytic murein transglycosylase D
LLTAIVLSAFSTQGVPWTLVGHEQTTWDQLALRQPILSTVKPEYFQAEVKRLLKNKRRLRKLAKRSAPYLQYILQETRDQQLPPELALLPIVESGFQPFSFSPVGATGLWQMMPGTASGYGLTLDWWYDARRDTVASTRAALGYLRYLHHYFHDWLLAIAAYNAGEGRILQAIHDHVRKHQPIDYWSLDLPKQTQDYVPTFLAYVEIFSHPKRYQLNIQSIKPNSIGTRFELQGPMHLSQIASLAGIDMATLRTYNPGYRRDITGPHYLTVLIPQYAVKRMKHNLQVLKQKKKPLAQWKDNAVQPGESLSQLAKKTVVDISINQQVVSESSLPGPKQIQYLVKPGDTRQTIAKNYRIKESDLIYWNGLTWGTPLVPGQYLNLWSEHIPTHTSTHRVKPGESLFLIAKKYHTSIQRIKEKNRLTSDNIRVNQKIMI